MGEYVFVKQCDSVCALHEMKSYIIPTPHPWMFDHHQAQKASGIEHRRQGTGRSDTYGDKVSPRRWLGRNWRL